MEMPKKVTMMVQRSTNKSVVQDFCTVHKKFLNGVGTRCLCSITVKGGRTAQLSTTDTQRWDANHSLLPK